MKSTSPSLRLVSNPAKSPGFDPDWSAHGHIDTVVRNAAAWVEAHVLPLLLDADRLTQMSQAARRLGHPRADEDLVDPHDRPVVERHPGRATGRERHDLAFHRAHAAVLKRRRPSAASMPSACCATSAAPAAAA